MTTEILRSQPPAAEGTGGHDSFAGWLRFRWLLPILIALLVSIGLLVRYGKLLNDDPGNVVPIGFAVVLSVLLSALPPVLCFVQNVSKRRQLSKLDSLRDLAVGKTTFFQTATRAIDSIRLVVDSDYAPPIFFFFILTFVGFLAILIGYSRDQFFETPSVLLGGVESRTDLKILKDYQIQTFCVIATAFIGSYVYSLSRIIERINNNDLYPISLYYYAVRVIVACAVAAVLRHTIGVVGDAARATLPQAISANAAPLLLLVGFGIGFAPDLFIVAISRKAFQAVKIWGSRNDPSEAARPTSLSLLMIDDLTRDKIDRMNELGIDSAQILAQQNPFLLLPRLPYDLGLLVDWISQAQLYVLVKDDKLQKLRRSCVRDIFDLYIRLKDDGTREEICKDLELSGAAGNVLLQQLDADSSFLRLRQVKAALNPVV